MNVSPDAFIQMAIQLAYYCLFHRGFLINYFFRVVNKLCSVVEL